MTKNKVDILSALVDLSFYKKNQLNISCLPKESEDVNNENYRLTYSLNVIKGYIFVSYTSYALDIKKQNLVFGNCYLGLESTSPGEIEFEILFFLNGIEIERKKHKCTNNRCILQKNIY